MKVNCGDKGMAYFEDLKCGDVFYSQYDAEYCMKIQRIQAENGMIINAVILSNGKPCSFAEDEVLELIGGEFVVK